MLQAAAHTDAVLLARPLRFDADEIRRLLDLGSPGVLCPFINSGDEATKLVQACRYPPAGIRGYGPRRAGVYGFDGDQYFQEANDAMIITGIIESAQAIENIDDIVKVDGFDGVTIGPWTCRFLWDASNSLNILSILQQSMRFDKHAGGTGKPWATAVKASRTPKDVQPWVTPCCWSRVTTRFLPRKRADT